MGCRAALSGAILLGEEKDLDRNVFWDNGRRLTTFVVTGLYGGPQMVAPVAPVAGGYHMAAGPQMTWCHCLCSFSPLLNKVWPGTGWSALASIGSEDREAAAAPSRSFRTVYTSGGKCPSHLRLGGIYRRQLEK